MQVFGLDHACHCFSRLMVNSSKLPASGSNIIAFAESNWCHVMILCYDLLKIFNCVCIRPLEI